MVLIMTTPLITIGNGCLVPLKLCTSEDRLMRKMNVMFAYSNAAKTEGLLLKNSFRLSSGDNIFY
jgi:hypothetical protein